MKTQSEWEESIAWTTVVAGCVVVNDEGRYLLVQEAQKKVYGLWNLPAGHVDKGESLEDAAVREVLEETGYEVELQGKVGAYHRAVEAPVCNVFKARVISGDLNAQAGEILDAGWFSFEEIIDMNQNKKFRADWIIEALTLVEKQTNK